MVFSGVLDLLKCKSLPQHSRKAVPLERDHVTSDAKQITSAHPILCLRFRRHGDKTALQQQQHSWRTAAMSFHIRLDDENGICP